MQNSIQKILLADDEAGLRAITNCLAGESCMVYYANEVSKALALAEDNRPDVIIVGWGLLMPQDLSAIRRVKACPDLQSVPILMAYGPLVAVEDLQRALEAGVHDFIRKPTVCVELKARIMGALGARKALQEAQRSREVLDTIQETHNKELALQTLFKHEKNEVLSSVRKRIGELGHVPVDYQAAKIDEISKQLEQGASNEKSWLAFEHYFKKLNPAYVKRLKDAHPSLTPNDVRMAIYIKMGMGNSEIAKVTGLKDGSVRVTINRLKKRLGLSPHQDIRDFLIAK